MCSFLNLSFFCKVGIILRNLGYIIYTYSVFTVGYGVGGKVSRIVGVYVMFFYYRQIRGAEVCWFGLVRSGSRTLLRDIYLSMSLLFFIFSDQDLWYKLDACAMGADS